MSRSFGHTNSIETKKYDVDEKSSSFEYLYKNNSCQSTQKCCLHGSSNQYNLCYSHSDTFEVPDNIKNRKFASQNAQSKPDITKTNFDVHKNQHLTDEINQETSRCCFITGSKLKKNGQKEKSFCKKCLLLSSGYFATDLADYIEKHKSITEKVFNTINKIIEHENSSKQQNVLCCKECAYLLENLPPSCTNVNVIKRDVSYS